MKQLLQGIGILFLACTSIDAKNKFKTNDKNKNMETDNFNKDSTIESHNRLESSIMKESLSFHKKKLIIVKKKRNCCAMSNLMKNREHQKSN